MQHLIKMVPIYFSKEAERQTVNTRLAKRELSESEIQDLSIAKSLSSKNRLLAIDESEFVDLISDEYDNLNISSTDRELLKNSFVCIPREQPIEFVDVELNANERPRLKSDGSMSSENWIDVS